MGITTPEAHIRFFVRLSLPIYLDLVPCLNLWIYPIAFGFHLHIDIAIQKVLWLLRLLWCETRSAMKQFIIIGKQDRIYIISPSNCFIFFVL